MFQRVIKLRECYTWGICNLQPYRPFKTRQAKEAERKKGKWQGRLEYLNRGDPFDEAGEKAKRAKESKEVEKMSISRRDRVYVWGNGECGALGQLGFLHPKGDRKRVLQMRRPFISSLSNYFNIKSVACGHGFTLFVTDDKERYLFGTGLNQLGQLGLQRRRNEAGREVGRPLETVIVPSSITLPLLNQERVRSVAAGRAHCLAVTSLGRVLAWGNNAYGQCGRPVIEQEDYAVNKVVHCMEADHVTRAVCGQDHSLLLDSAGEVHSCGWGADGQTGQGHYDNTGKLRKLAGDIQGERVVKLACAADCVLALSDSGDVFGWGNSEYGQLRSVTSEQQVAVPTRLPLHDVGRVTDIASSGTQCLLVNAEGQVWVWGFGILGLGPKLESSARPLPIPAPIFGQGVFGGAGKVERVFAGLGHLAAVTDQGDLFLWGKNRKSCLGLQTEDDRYFPLKVPIGGKVKQLSLGCDHSVAIVRPWMG